MLAAISIPSTLIGIGLIAVLVSVLRPWIKSGSWRTAPLELVAFVCFSALVVLLDAGIQALAPAFATDSIKYTGWVPSMLYMFVVITGTFLCVHRTARGRIWLLVFLGLWAVGHAFEFWSDFGEEDFDNPYLRVSPYQLIWTVGIPLVWLVVLLSPRVKRYCSIRKPSYRPPVITWPPSQDPG